METIQTYSTKKWILIIPLLSGIFLLILGIKGYLEYDNLTLLLIALLFGTIAIASVLNIFPFVSSIITTPKGILVRSFFRKTFVQWKEIESFENKKVLFQNKIAIHFKPTYGKKFLGIPIGKRRNNFTAVLPIQYNVKAEELQIKIGEFNRK
jgi:hypothetical protein